MKSIVMISLMVPDDEVDDLCRKLDLLAATRGLTIGTGAGGRGGRVKGSPNRAALVRVLIDEAFAALPEARLTTEEQDAILESFRRDNEVTDDRALAAFAAAGGNMTAAAREVGMTPSGLAYRLKSIARRSKAAPEERR